MTYLPEHQYCNASLSFQLLKKSDRAVADVLSQAKKEVNDLHVVKVSKFKIGQLLATMVMIILW